MATPLHNEVDILDSKKKERNIFINNRYATHCTNKRTSPLFFCSSIVCVRGSCDFFSLYFFVSFSMSLTSKFKMLMPNTGFIRLHERETKMPSITRKSLTIFNDTQFAEWFILNYHILTLYSTKKTRIQTHISLHSRWFFICSIYLAPKCNRHQKFTQIQIDFVL